MPEHIDQVSIADETRRRYLNYALSVIMSRALPDVRDGLKPVQRRILFNMYQDHHLYFNERPIKSAKVVGDVMGSYHPHGDSAIYDALVRMAQPFSLRGPLVFGEGNFGSVDGHPPAAYRYTECKLQRLAEEMMTELRQETVDLKPTYDGTRQEPVVLPARFPQLLVNGAAGIAVGMATSIPPHNLGDTIRAAVLLIENKNATTAELLDRLKGPDFPLGAKILADRKTLRTIYEEGTGTIKVQAEWKTEEPGKKKQIVVTSIPYGVNKGTLEERIGQIIGDRSLPQLLNLTNESNEKEGIRIVLEIRPDADPEVVMAYLFKHTALQENFSCNFTCLVPSGHARERGQQAAVKPERIGLKAMLRYFLDFRLETIRRRYEYYRDQLKKRIHILEGFRKAFNVLDLVIKLIRESEGKADAAEKLIDKVKLDALQADAILELLLYKIARLEIKKILEELREKKEELARIEELLGSEKKLWAVVKKELEELAETHGDRRRTRIVSEEETPEFDPEAYIIRENTHVVLTRDGWLKRVGRLTSLETTRVREGDEVRAVLPASTHDFVVFFSDDGSAYTLRASEIPASSGYGEPISKFFRLGEGRRIVTGVTCDPRFTPEDHKPTKKANADDPPLPYLLVVTAFGQVLKVSLSAYRTASTVKGRQYCRLNEGDEVVNVFLLNGQKSLMLASQEGHVLHFALDEVPVLSGAGKGVIGIKLGEDDRCLGGVLIRNQNDAMVLETSGGKTQEFYGSREQASRGGKGFRAVTRTSFTKLVPPAIELVNWEEIEAREAEGKHGPRLFT